MLGDMDEDDIFGERAKDSEWDGAEVFSENAGAPAPAPVQSSVAPSRAAPEPDIAYLEEGGGGGGGGGSAPAAASEPDLPPAPRSKHWYHISHWAYLFDVNTYDVFKRMLKTFVPVGPSFWEHIGKNPDYYGPFWIALTLAFCTALTANLGGYFQAELCSNSTRNETAVFTSNIDAAAVATGTFLGWTFVLPILFWGLFKWWTVENAQAKNLVCLYGYSLTPYLPLSFFCLIPHDYARWIVVAIGCAFNALFLVLAIFQLLRHDHMVKAIPTCVGVLVLSLGLGLGLKLYFWQFDSC